MHKSSKLGGKILFADRVTICIKYKEGNNRPSSVNQISLVHNQYNLIILQLSLVVQIGRLLHFLYGKGFSLCYWQRLYYLVYFIHICLYLAVRISWRVYFLIIPVWLSTWLHYTILIFIVSKYLFRSEWCKLFLNLFRSLDLCIGCIMKSICLWLNILNPTTSVS